MVTLAVQPRVQERHCLSEVFLLKPAELKLLSFRLAPVPDREDGLRLSYHLSRYLPDVIVVWQDGLFFGLAKQGQSLPSDPEWAEALAYLQRETKQSSESIGRFQKLLDPQCTPEILALLAEQILRVNPPFKSKAVLSSQSVAVRRRADFGAEVIEIDQTRRSALTLSPHSRITFQGTLSNFLANHPYRQNPEQLLVGLKVETFGLVKK